MDRFGPKSTADAPPKPCLLVQTVLSNVMWLLAWAWQEESHCLCPSLLSAEFVTTLKTDWVLPTFVLPYASAWKRCCSLIGWCTHFREQVPKGRCRKGLFLPWFLLKGLGVWCIAGSVLFLLGAQHFSFLWVLCSSGSSPSIQGVCFQLAC